MARTDLDLSPFELAQLVADTGIGSPDTRDSAGAEFLLSVQTAVEEAIAYGPWEDAAYEIADGAVPVYTHQLWLTFVDLAAYNVEVEGYVEADGDTDMTKRAAFALFHVAATLAEILLGEDDEPKEDRE